MMILHEQKYRDKEKIIRNIERYYAHISNTLDTQTVDEISLDEMVLDYLVHDEEENQPS